jgi:hypothetical protein
MSYKFDIAMSATIDDTVAMDIVVAAVEHQTGKKVLSIQSLYDGNKFNGFQVTFDPDTKSKILPFKSSKEFIVETFDK